MAVFGKKSEGPGPADDSDFLRIPPGTRIAAGPDGKLMMAFAGDMSFGEGLPELSELSAGRNLSIDAGVTVRADAIRVKATLEIEAGARLLVQSIEAERVVSRKGQIEARTITAGSIELEGSRVVVDRVTAREGVVIDRGEVEVGTVLAQTLSVTKGTIANILITEVARLDGAITKGGYQNFGEFLSKVVLYHPEVLNDRFSAEARKMAGGSGGDSLGSEARSAGPGEAGGDTTPLDAAALARLQADGQRLRAIYQDRDMPREIAELAGLLEAQKVEEVRKNLTPVYQKLAPQGKLPEQVLDVFREIQRTLRGGALRAAPAAPARTA